VLPWAWNYHGRDAWQLAVVTPGTPLALFGEARSLGVPLVAIGGITLENAPQLLRAGADCLAVISDLFDAPDIAGRARSYGKLWPHEITQ